MAHIQKSIKSQLYCSSDDAAADDAGEAAGGGAVAAGGFLHAKNVVIRSCERCFFFGSKMLL